MCPKRRLLTGGHKTVPSLAKRILFHREDRSCANKDIPVFNSGVSDIRSPSRHALRVQMVSKIEPSFQAYTEGQRSRKKKGKKQQGIST